jgi:hypothetical protein
LIDSKFPLSVRQMERAGHKRHHAEKHDSGGDNVPAQCPPTGCLLAARGFVRCVHVHSTDLDQRLTPLGH